jgi:hypothetical protein
MSSTYTFIFLYKLLVYRGVYFHSNPRTSFRLPMKSPLLGESTKSWGYTLMGREVEWV